jgi:O-Antigen ligase
MSANNATAARWPRPHTQVPRYAVLALLFALLVVDGFPGGVAILREFGARIDNFILAAAALYLISRRAAQANGLRFGRAEVIVAATVLLAVPAINFPVAVLQSDVSFANVLTDWLSQYLMFAWAIASYYIWIALLRDVTDERLARTLCIGALVPLAAFFIEFASASDVIQPLLELIRVKRDTRPSGLATEPALFSAWTAFAWPYALYYAGNARSIALRVFGGVLFAAIAASAYFSNARTIAVIVVIQLVFYAYWVMRAYRGVRLVRALGMITLVGVAVVAVAASRLLSITNVVDQGSNISRLGSTATAIKVALAHPIVGIGIGQFRYFFASYAPDFALASQEILARAAGLTEYRASSFNLFVRLSCEFGAAAAVVFSFYLIRPIILATRSRRRSPFVFYATLGVVGGVGFWLSSDQYAYQPAILSLAILTRTLGNREPHQPAT